MEILIFLLFATGFVLYALGLSSFGKNSLHAQTFFHLGALLFILFFYKRFQKQDFKALKIPLLCFGIVVICGLLTYFNPILPRTFSQVLSAVNSNVVGYLPLFLAGFLFALYAKRELVIICFVFIGLLCAIDVYGTIEVASKSNTTYNVPFYFQAVYTISFWLFLSSAICISGVFVFKKWWLKILCLLGLIPCVQAILGNGERSFFVAFIVMIIAPFLLYRYKYKKITLPLFFVLCVGLGFYGYHYSKTLPERYNFAHMMENFTIVWSSAPSEMGKYDALCFNGWFVCAKESTKDGKNPISWEHSSLARIAMNKSALLAILENPIKPHIVGAYQMGEYLWHYYNNPNTKNPQNRVYASISDSKHNGYNNPHNFILSFMLAYGLFGFMAIATFAGMLFARARKFSINANSRFDRLVALSLCVLICGFCAHFLFDSVFNIVLQPLFILFGFVYGYVSRKQENSFVKAKEFLKIYTSKFKTFSKNTLLNLHEIITQRGQTKQNYGKKVRLEDSHNMQENKTKEQRALKVSMYCALLLAIFGIGFGQFMKSSAIIFDGIVCLVSVALGLLSVVTSRYIYKEDDDIFQYGYVRFEPMVNFFKSAVLLAVCVYALLSGVHSVIKGGYSLELGSAVIYTICAFVLCLGIFAYTHFYAERLDSELLYVDRTEWLIDCALYFGAIVAFGCVYLFDPQQKSAISHYIDPLLLIFLSFGLAFSPLKIMIANFKDLVMVAPPELDSQITQIMQDLSKEYGFSEYDTHVAKSGRFFMIEVNILDTHGLSINAKELDIIREKIQHALKLPSYRIWLLVSLTANPKWL